MEKDALTHDTTGLGRFIKERRRALGMSQQELSWHARWSMSNLCRLEVGHYGTPTVWTLERLAGVLEVPLCELLRAAGVQFENCKH